MSARSIRRARQREIEREARRRLVSKRSAGAAAGAALGASVVFAATAEAATFTVTNLNDAGAGSLRQAVQDANLTADADTIVFQSGLSGTITLTTGEISIDEPLDVQGPGAEVITVSGNDASQIFDAQTDNDPLSISGLTFTGGNGPDAGAIRTDDVALTIANSVFTGNYSQDRGGAFYAEEGTLEVTGSTFTGNVADNDAGAIGKADTLGANPVEVVIRDSVFTGNVAGGQGGGLYLFSLDSGAVVQNSTFVDNRADDDGGGIFADSPSALGDVTIDSVTVSGNTSGDEGGGIFLDDDGNDPNDPIHIVQNSTISGNTAGDAGGGVALDAAEPSGEDALIRNSTITGNTAGGRGGGVYRSEYYVSMGVYGGDSPVISSAIVAANNAVTGPDLSQSPDLDSGDGSFRLGFSLIGSTDSATITENPAGSNLIGVDPLLGPLADNGGPTQTMLPAIGSPALDAGIANGLATEQRGTQRTFDASNIANAAAGDATDIGATELVATGTCRGKAATVLFAPGQPVTGSAGTDVVVGTSGADNINSGGGKDTVCAAGGKDKVNAAGGKDNVSGQAGNDKLKGGAGKDKLSGNAGKDTLKGQGGKDTLKGGGGKDKLVGGPGKDKLKGGGGKDTERQ